MKTLTYKIILVIILSCISNAQSLYINEFMASNSSSIQDPDYNAYPDWIEIYNAEMSAVNLVDYFITDDPEDPQKYKIITDLVIPPQGYILIWADDMNTGSHANFQLSASGEFVGLYNPSVEVVDTITFTGQQNNVSSGRFPDGGSEWYRFYPSTPGTSNPEINRMLSEPEFSIKGGFYNSAVTLTLTHPDPGVTIAYTTNGTIPDTGSIISAGPVSLTTNTAVTAIAFKDGFTKSKPVVNTYFLNFETELPVFSIVTDPANFFSDTSGIYVIGTNGIPGRCVTEPRNWNQEWQRPVNLEFYENNKQPAFNVTTGIQIYGGCTRIYAMKSLAFYFKDEYDYSRLNYRLFPGIPVLSYNNFILRSSGQDWWRTMFRDGMVQTLVSQGMRISYQAFRPSLVFLNGQYWGIHNIREKYNEHYLNSHYGVDPDNVDIIEVGKTGRANSGDLTAFTSMMNFISASNLADPSNYEYIKSIVDVDDYIDYQIAQIYSANADWPGSNMKTWRERSASGKWRWLLYDVDFTFGGNARSLFDTNTLEWATAENSTAGANPPWSTLMLRKMLTNPEFKNEFIQRFAVHMNTTFQPDHVLSVVDSLSGLIASEIPRHKARWPQSISLGNDWQVNIKVVKDFAVKRQPYVRKHFSEKFNLSGSYSLIISRNNPAWGKIYTHNVEVKRNSSLNIFFEGIPLKVKALPMPGYRFVGWEGVSNSTSPEIEVNTTVNSFLRAVFEPSELLVTTLVINEINYKSSASFDTEDWIELYNPLAGEVDISGWKITDKNPSHVFTFPEGSKIKGNGYVVVCRDTSMFKSIQLNVSNVYGNLGFGLSNENDIIILSDLHDNLIDSVYYESSGEWTSLPNGNGPTLSLVDPQKDNTLAINWRASGSYGTPGRLNDTYTDIDKEEPVNNYSYQLYENYPNPFNPATNIRYSLAAGADITLIIYDLLGREVEVLVNEYKSAGVYEINWTAGNIPSGVYFYQLKSGSYVNSKKMVLLK